MTDAQTAADYLRAVADSTEHLFHTVAELDPATLTEPSALPGWTRGHVLSHVARNADALVNALDTARTGEDIPMYASADAREQGIEDGAGRPLDVQLADLRESTERFLAAAALLRDEAWSVQLRHPRTGHVFPAYEVPLKRLQELEYHLVDLDAGYTPAHWPESFAVREFTNLARRFSTLEDVPRVLLVADDVDLREQLGAEGETELTVEGPVRGLAAWLSGRSDGDGLQVHRDGVLVPDARSALPKLPVLG